MEHVKEIVHETGRRERRKLEQVKTIRGVIAACLFSHEPRLRKALDLIAQ